MVFEHRGIVDLRSSDFLVGHSSYAKTCIGEFLNPRKGQVAQAEADGGESGGQKEQSTAAPADFVLGVWNRRWIVQRTSAVAV
jgi:hypothetical protein